MDPKFRSHDLLTIRRPVQIFKLHPGAELPSRENRSDAYHELSVVARCDNRIDDVQNDVNTFATGLRIQCPRDYHVEIFEHPDLYKAGYSLAGGIRFVNPTDDNEVILPLLKYKECEDIELPFKVAVMVVRQTEYASVTPATVRRGGARSRNGRSSIAATQSHNFDDDEEPEQDLEPAPRRGGRSSSVHSVKSTKSTKSGKSQSSKGNHMF